MGTAEIKYGDSICFIQHVYSGLWLTYTTDSKSVGSFGGQRKVKLFKYKISKIKKDYFKALGTQ